MRFSSGGLQKLGKQVVGAMLIGRKKNVAGISRAKKVFPKIFAFLKKFDGKVLSEKQLAASGVNKKILSLLSNPEIGPIIAKRGKKFAVRSTVGESVRLVYHPDNWELAKQIVLAAARNGAHVAFTPRYSELDREAISASPLEKLEDFPAMSLATMKSIDVTIYLECEDDPLWKKGIARVKLTAGQDNSQKAHEILDDRKVRWLVLGWPFAKTARSFGVPPKFFEKMLFASIKESFKKRTHDLIYYYKQALSGKNKVRLVHEDDTDLSFSIKGRPMLVDLGFLDDESIRIGDVGLNIPSGEAFCAPVEGSAEGKIFFPKIYAEGHGFVHGLWLFFEKGRVARYTAQKGKENFDKYLAENTPSTRMLAELGIGCNRAAKLTGYILTDEKIAGTIHLAIGNNTGSYHGKNKASGHLDMVKDMASGKLLADGKIVMKNGWPA